MIIIPILLALFTWILILWLFEQYKHINIFEQIALWFVSALSLFVFELFLQWIIFDKLSLLLPILSFVICLWLFIFKCIKTKWYWKKIMNSIKWNFIDMKNQFKSQKLWQKILVCFFCVYALAKCFMAFSINLHMPTFDEDAVVWRDLKTKVYTENRGLVLDKSSPEYLWSAYERNIFAPLTDTYFLLASDWINVNQTDIISPIIYLLSVLVLFGILLRKWNLLFASLSWYLFTSLPFIFIHWIWSYQNLSSWVLIFILSFYFIDQLLKEKNKFIIYPLMFLWFLSATMRNESPILSIAIILVSLLFHIILDKKQNYNKETLKYTWIILWALIIWTISMKIMNSLAPTELWVWFKDDWVVSTFFEHLMWWWLISQMLEQWFLHPDFNILYLALVILIILSIIIKIKYKEIFIYFVPFITLIGWTVAMLIYNLDVRVWYFWFVRYSAVYIIFMAFLLTYLLYLVYQKILEK